jgi:hypothetical protein
MKGQKKHAENGKKLSGKSNFSSRITSGLRLLPGVDGRSTPARVMRDVMLNMTAHCGGHDHISEARRLLVRRVACLEAELIAMEDRFARQRVDGDAPSPKALDLYQRMAGSQRRVLEALGLDPTLRDITPPPDPLTYAAHYRREAEDAEVEA